MYWPTEFASEITKIPVSTINMLVRQEKAIPAIRGSRGRTNLFNKMGLFALSLGQLGRSVMQLDDASAWGLCKWASDLTEAQLQKNFSREEIALPFIPGVAVMYAPMHVDAIRDMPVEILQLAHDRGFAMPAAIDLKRIWDNLEAILEKRQAEAAETPNRLPRKRKSPK